MVDATDVKAHPTASSLNKGVVHPAWSVAAEGMTSKRPVVCDRPGRPVRLHLREGQCSNFASAAVLLRERPGGTALMGDKGYDSDKIRTRLESRTARGCTQWAIRLRTCWPDSRTGAGLPPAMTAVLLFLSAILLGATVLFW